MLGKLGQTFSRLGASSGSSLGWIPNPTNKPDIAINWSSNKAWTKTGGLTTPAALGITTSRASVKQVVDGNGNWSQVASNVTAMSNLGRSTEEARTNSIRNNTMQGAVAGSPGTLPTNWIAGVLSGLAINVIGTGTESGIDYIDVQFVGTPGSTSGFSLLFDSSTGIAALPGQTWTGSAFIYSVGGSLTNVVSYQLFTEPRTSGGGGGIGSSPTTFVPGAGPLGSSRIQNSFTNANSTSANEVLRVVLNVTSGQAINTTLRIGWPQLENNSINSTVASATVAAGGASGVTGTAVYSVGGGTGTAATLNVTVSGGAITAINSVASAGSYTVFPTSPAALTYVSGTGSGVVGATVNLTPTNLAVNAFATSPIKTTAGAATRAADVTSLVGQTFGSAYSMFEQATPQAPTGYTTNQGLLTFNDGTAANRIGMYRSANGGPGTFLNIIASVAQLTPANASVLTQNTSAKMAFAAAAGAQSGSKDGAAALNSVSASIPSPNTVVFGNPGTGGGQFNGLAAIDAIWLTQAVPSAQLVTMTT